MFEAAGKSAAEAVVLRADQSMIYNTQHAGTWVMNLEVGYERLAHF